jgi:hypothetical protein
MGYRGYRVSVTIRLSIRIQQYTIYGIRVKGQGPGARDHEGALGFYFILLRSPSRAEPISFVRCPCRLEKGDTPKLPSRVSGAKRETRAK